MRDGVPTVGVEEEFLLTAADGTLRMDSSLVTADARAEGLDLQPELVACQIETNSVVCRTAEELGTEIRGLRRVAAEAAARHDLRLLAVGVPLVGPREQPASAGRRYQAIESAFPGLTHEHGICGCHVHVGVPDREAAIQVSNRIVRWLPTVLALTANSPLYGGTDTGCVSWRSIMWRRWPSAGPPPRFVDAADYDRTVATMIECGSILDEGMIYWDVRPSATFPTVEVRVSDVPATADETVVLALLIRALVTTALRDAVAARPDPEIPAHVLDAAYWRAARSGLASDAVDPVAGRLIPAALLVERMLDYVSDALDEAGDRSVVVTGLRAGIARGNGAYRQRAAWARRGLLADVVDVVAEDTLRGCL